MKVKGNDTYKKMDTKKVLALKSAGWINEKIAKEMETSVELVEEILKYCDSEAENETESEKEENNEEDALIVIPVAEFRKIYEEAALIGAKEGIKAFERERKKEYSTRSNRRLMNTKLLLRNYNMLKKHAENSVFGRTQMRESAMDILESMMSMYDNEVIIESIKRSATRTAVIISHIETMFGLYEVYCDKSPNRDIETRRYTVLRDMYIAEDALSPKEIAEKHNISKDTVYSDLRIATERLTALIFGVDGLNVH